ITDWVEKELVRPLLRGRDISRWHAAPSAYILCPYSKRFPKNPMPENYLEENYPQAMNFFRKFEENLASRKEYRRWKGKNPFYELYRIGEYTFSDYRVVWQHTGFKDKFRAALLEADQLEVIPDQKVILIPVETSEEGSYIVSLLNSKVIEDCLKRFMLLDASPQILEFIKIIKFDPKNKLHQEIAELGKDAKNVVKSKEGKDRIDLIEKHVNTKVEQLYSENS
ncbi:MAG: hypothetical protein HQK54_03015, partial [Oligoflexales bacterium]|nr:hypothetical protein [Oligoflexales bacterium]